MREMETRRLLSYLRRAVDDYEMIAPGDRIAVGISGGKDSLALLCGLAALKHFYPHPFELVALTVDMGFPTADYSAVEALCRELDVPYHIKKTEIATIIFDIRKEKNPCSLCAKMRRGALNDLCVEMGINKLALGHHREDAEESVSSTYHAAWNAMPNDQKPPLASPRLVHYNLFAKPWCYDNIQYEELFWHYAKDSGYLDAIRASKVAYSDAQKAADGACLRLLVQRGTEIGAQEITFKKLSDKGVKIRL